MFGGYLGRGQYLVIPTEAGVASSKKVARTASPRHNPAG